MDLKAIDTSLNIDLLNESAEMLKAMAHPIRIAIIKLLSKGKPLTVSEIHEILEIQQSATSHHLSIMKSHHLVCAKRKGKNIYYTLSHERLANIIQCIHQCQGYKNL